MKNSKSHTHGKPRITRLILRTSMSLCLAGVVGLAQVDTAQAARWGGGGNWGGGGGGDWGGGGGNWGGGGSSDNTAPTVPSSLTATAASSSQIDLSWKASSDSVGVKGYKVYRGSTQVATVSGTSFSNTGLSANTKYTYTVAAYDAAGNTSSKSSSASATTTSSSSGGGTGGGSGDVVSGAPAGIYSIDTVVDKPFVDGVLVRIYWSEIEKTEGKYDFSKLDSTLQKAEAAGQSVSIATMVMAAPTWLESKSTTYNDPQFGKTIVPWDTTMLSALEKLITALSTHQINGTAVKDHPTVKQVDAAIGGIQSVRLTQLPSGYSASKFKDSVNRSVSAWAKAFPNKNIYVGLFGVSDNEPSTTEDIRDDLMAQYSNINFFQEVLSGSAPNGPLGDVLKPAVGKAGIMFQACGEWSNQKAWSWCNYPKGDTPSAGMSNGFDNFNATYFEMYVNDLNNSSYSTQFQQWHDKLAPYLP
jgi:hypothetical protein